MSNILNNTIEYNFQNIKNKEILETCLLENCKDSCVSGKSSLEKYLFENYKNSCMSGINCYGN